MSAKMRTPLSALVVLLGAVGAWLLAAGRREVQPRPPEILPPVVTVVSARPREVQLRVRAHGTVAPRTQSDLFPEVPGRVIYVSPAFAAGGFFDRGEVLLEIDPRDYEVALSIARAALARYESELGLARRKLDRLRKLASSHVASPAAIDEAEHAERVASAAVSEAGANLRQAVLNLERTRLLAPFAGRIRETRVDLGQFVTPGAPVAKLYAVDYAEVRLPIPDADLAFLELPLDYGGEPDRGRGPTVYLYGRYAGNRHRWTGHIVRVEGEVDPRSRMVHLVARVDDPYGRGQDASDGPPMAVGLFVEAEILGRRLDGVVVLPRSALRADRQVLVVDASARLRFRTVEVIRVDRGQVLIRAGIAEGDRVCISPLDAAVDGMKVRTVLVDGSGGPPTSSSDASRGAARTASPVRAGAATRPLARRG